MASQACRARRLQHEAAAVMPLLRDEAEADAYTVGRQLAAQPLLARHACRQFAVAGQGLLEHRTPARIELAIDIGHHRFIIEAHVCLLRAAPPAPTAAPRGRAPAGSSGYRSESPAPRP